MKTIGASWEIHRKAISSAKGIMKQSQEHHNQILRKPREPHAGIMDKSYGDPEGDQRKTHEKLKKSWTNHRKTTRTSN